MEASVSYETKGNIIIFNRTDVPSKLQGKGVGKLLAQVSTCIPTYLYKLILLICA